MGTDSRNLLKFRAHLYVNNVLVQSPQDTMQI